MKLRVLLTGSTGFLGRALIRHFEHIDNVELILLVRRKLGNSFHKQIVYDDLDQYDCSLNIHCLIHCAGLAHADLPCNFSSARKYVNANVDLTRRLVAFSNRILVKQFIFMSTINVHADLGKVTVSENSKLYPSDLYSSSKIKCESIVQNGFNNGVTSYLIVRPTVIYDPGVALNKGNIRRIQMIVQKLHILPLPSVSGHQNYTSIRNLCTFIHHLIFHSISRDQIYVLSDCSPLTIGGLAQKLKKSSSQFLLIVYLPNWILKFILRLLGREHYFRKIERSLRTDIRKAKRTGWRPLD